MQGQAKKLNISKSDNTCAAQSQNHNKNAQQHESVIRGATKCTSTSVHGSISKIVATKEKHIDGAQRQIHRLM